MTAAKANPTVPGALSEVALIDARTATAGGGMSVSWWHAQVASGVAPAPAIRRPRLTRWRLSDVTKFWRDFSTQDHDSEQIAARVRAHAAKASAAAQSKRRASSTASKRQASASQGAAR